VTPIRPVEEGFRDDEAAVGDIAILAGQYIIIAVVDEPIADGDRGYVMTNYLRVTRVEEVNRTRHGANQQRHSEALIECCFR